MTCPKCRANLWECNGVTIARPPTLGDVIVCMSCGAVSKVIAGTNLVEAEQDYLDALPKMDRLHVAAASAVAKHLAMLRAYRKEENENDAPSKR